jgi:hypothetical protein
MSTTEEWGKFTSVVAPVLIAFTMPTVALIATSKDQLQRAAAAAAQGTAGSAARRLDLTSCYGVAGGCG